MKNYLLKEDITASPDDLKRATPREDDFVLISEAYIDVKINGTSAIPEYQLTKLVEADLGEVDAPIRFMIVAALLGWTEGINAFKQRCFYYELDLPYLKGIIAAVKAQKQAYLEAMYEKYCEPAIETVQKYLTNQPPSFKTAREKFSFIVRYMVKHKDVNVIDIGLNKLDNTGFMYLEGHRGTSQNSNYIIAANCQYSESQSRWKLTIAKSEYFSPNHEVLLIESGQDWDQLLQKLGIYFNAPDPQTAEYANLIKESLQIDSQEGLTETIEKHDKLNPALFNENDKLKSEVREKILEIVDEFLKEFDKVDVELAVRDIILTGSNASYNYTKDSDLDIHILADTSNIEDTLKLHKVIYDAYKSAFNRKFEIELNKVPVELYVETEDTPLVSNGIYSINADSWHKFPVRETIPDIDQKQFNQAFKSWEKQYKELVATAAKEVEDETQIDAFIDSLYDLRAQGLTTAGEYSIENLVFKEMRNKGYLDQLKELRQELIARRLSLRENLTRLVDCIAVITKK